MAGQPGSQCPPGPGPERARLPDPAPTAVHPLGLPTEALPRSDEKLQVMHDRAKRCEGLFHPKDARGRASPQPRPKLPSGVQEDRLTGRYLARAKRKGGKYHRLGSHLTVALALEAIRAWLAG